MQETLEKRIWSLGQEDPLEEGMVTQSSILAWRIPEQSLLGCSPWGRRVQHDWSDLAAAAIMVDLVSLKSKESSRKLRFVIFYFANPSFLFHSPISQARSFLWFLWNKQLVEWALEWIKKECLYLLIWDKYLFTSSWQPSGPLIFHLKC